MNAETGSRRATDGILLFTRRWRPTGDPRSAVVLVHGIAEHAGRYEHVGAALAARGHDVRATDLRGFGRSDGRRAAVNDWHEYLDDLSGDIASARHLGVPVVLLGHSLGGLIALSYALSDRPGPDLLVLSAPAVDAAIPLYKKIAARVLGVVSPNKEIGNALDGAQLCRDPTVGERYFADPLLHARTTLGLGRAALRAGDRARAQFARLQVPTLVIHGGADTIVPPPISAPLGELPGVERVLFPSFRHESFNEEGGAQAIATIADWLESRIESLGS
ncbi:MAG: lysophospholipase [Actinomycetota bacterium]|jgi:alpha-beta hydrolase superfamily lysophospholipase|nr:lysophospholipase [Actinomycetota bacterium]